MAINRCALPSNKAIFVDKDGTLTHDIPYNVNPELIELAPGVVTALQGLQHYGYRIIVISNQSGVARGIFKEEALLMVQKRLQSLLAQHGIRLFGFYYCPHHPDAERLAYRINCDCRKPKPGMLFHAAYVHHIDLQQSWMVGDILSDSEAGNRAGCRTILIEKAYDPIPEATISNRPDFQVTDWLTASQVIIANTHIQSR
jgi:D-glycero-D-manno-heptose 1,7-bisphosphate phosphatase